MKSSNKVKLFTEHPRTRSRLILFSLMVLTGFSLISGKIAFLASKENKKNTSYTEREEIHSRLNIADIYWGQSSENEPTVLVGKRLIGIEHEE